MSDDSSKKRSWNPLYSLMQISIFDNVMLPLYPECVSVDTPSQVRKARQSVTYLENSLIVCKQQV